ncbi:MAG: hypothetical protein ACM3SR_15845 [Ignavibacteriales bacterium]
MAFVTSIGFDELESSIETMDAIVHDPLIGEGVGVVFDFRYITYILGVKESGQLARENSGDLKSILWLF